MFDFSKLLEILPSVLNIFSQLNSPATSSSNNDFNNINSENYAQNYHNNNNNNNQNDYYENHASNPYWQLPNYNYAQNTHNLNTMQFQNVHNIDRNNMYNNSSNTYNEPLPKNEEKTENKSIDIMQMVGLVSKLLELFPKIENKKEEVSTSSINNLTKTDNYNFN